MLVPMVGYSPTIDPEFVARASESDDEVAVFEFAERVVGVDAAEHSSRLLGPGERVVGADAVVHLHHAPVEDAIFGPRPGEVLHARHLDPRLVARGREPSHSVPVRVTGEVPGEGWSPRS